MELPRLLATAALAASVAVPVAIAPPAAALSCVGPPMVIADAVLVYAGRIVDARDNRILIDVTEVWKGGPVEEQVWLEVEAVGWTPWADRGGEIPDGYESPKKWVFAPHDAAVGPCNAWSLDRGTRQYLLPHRPDQPQAPVAEDEQQDAGEATPPTEGSASSAWPLLGGVGGALFVLVTLAVAVVVRRRHRA